MEQNLYLNVLNDSAAAVADAGSMEEALARTVDTVARHLQFDVCSIYLYDSHESKLVLAATHGLHSGSVGKVEMRLEEGLTGLVAETRRPFHTTDAEAHPRFKFFPETGEERFSSFAGVPLLRQGLLVGVLTAQTVETHEFHADELVMLQTLAGMVVSVIDVSKIVAREKPRKPGRHSFCLSGLGTSPGIGMARAVTVGERVEDLPLPAQPFQGEEQEQARFERALADSFSEVDRLADRLRESGAAGEAIEILQAHKAILADPTFQETVRERIRDKKLGAIRAVDSAFKPMLRAFRKMKVPLLREKAHDLADARAQLLSHLGVDLGIEIPTDEPAVVMAQHLSPAETAKLDVATVVAVVTEHGSETSHMSILARSRGIPAVVGVPGLLAKARRGDKLLVDGHNGFVFVNPDKATIKEYFERKEQEESGEHAIAGELARLDDAGRPAAHQVEVNLGFAGEIARARACGARSVGLLRTEFFFMQQRAWPDVALQVAFYRPILEALAGGEVTIRLVDIGGDKLLPFMEEMGEPNPILGSRSVRLLLDHPEVLRTQVRAILEAARAVPATRVRIMVPMVTTLWEMRAARQHYREVAAEAGIESPPPFGMMIEVPAVLFMLEAYLADADFFSVGSNDLVQYLMAVDRDNERVHNRYVPHHPAVLRALRLAASRLEPHDRVPSVCGEMAGQPATALALMALGYRRFSVTIRAFPVVRYLSHAVAGMDLAPLRAELLRLDTSEAVEWTLRDVLQQVAPLLARLS